MSSIRRLICNSEKGGGSTAEGARRLQGAPVVREGEKYLFSSSCQYKLHYLLGCSRGSVALCTQKTSAVTCQSNPDRRWPCSALLEMIPVDLVFQRWFCGHFCGNRLVKEVPRHIKWHQLSRIRWFIELGAEGPDQFLLHANLFMRPSVLFWWASRITRWKHSWEHPNAPSDLT